MKGCKISKDVKKSAKDDSGTRIFIVIIICAVIICIILQFGLQAYARIVLSKGAVDETWVSSLASYWGGILGGLISGSLAYIGVRLTIRYYKESDAKREAADKEAQAVKERDEVRPFLHVKAAGKAGAPQGAIPLGTGSENNMKSGIKVKVSNIGNGFAYTSVIDSYRKDGNNRAYNKIFEKGTETELYFKVDSDCLTEGTKIPFSIYYIDSKGNKYIQSYEMLGKGKSSIPRIDNGYPKFIEKVGHIIEINEGETESE